MVTVGGFSSFRFLRNVCSVSTAIHREFARGEPGEATQLNTPHTNGNEPRRLPAPGANFWEALAADQAASGADQSGADTDQTAQDTDQTGSERDQAAAESDQAASNRDQTTADRDQAAELAPTDADTEAYELSREEREAGTQSRMVNQADRETSASTRMLSAGERDAMATARDEGARRRDARAEAIDRLTPPTLHSSTKCGCSEPRRLRIALARPPIANAPLRIEPWPPWNGDDSRTGCAPLTSTT